MRTTSRISTLVVLSGVCLCISYVNLRPDEESGSRIRPGITDVAPASASTSPLLVRPVTATPKSSVDHRVARGAPDLAESPSDSSKGTRHAGGFLPFPNKGEADFAEKYSQLTGQELHSILAPMNKEMSTYVEDIAAVQFDSGVFVSRSPGASTLNDPELAYHDQPVGLGRVWPVSRAVALGGGQGEVQITYVTESEYPELFAMQDEYLYAARLWRSLSLSGD